MPFPQLLAIGIAILTPDAAEPARIVVEAAPAPAGSKLTLHRIDPDSGEAGPAIFAKVVTIESGGLQLKPSFGLSRGTVYRAILKPPEGKPVSADHRIPATTVAGVPKVVKVYPTPEKIPANLLKFYLYFGQPMREGLEIFEQMHIENDQGERVHAPWRQRELWSDGARRLTLWIHPGRVKRGVNLREELGPVLLPGRTYTLVIDATIRSATGAPLGQEFRHEFSTLPEDHERPLAEDWKLEIPTAGTREPLRVVSPEPLDHILIARHVKVVDGEGEEVETEITIEPGESAWTFRPVAPWKNGATYRLRVSGFLEDLAGNTPARVFDTDLTQEPVKPGAEFVEFEPGPAR